MLLTTIWAFFVGLVHRTSHALRTVPKYRLILAAIPNISFRFIPYQEFDFPRPRKKYTSSKYQNQKMRTKLDKKNMKTKKRYRDPIDNIEKQRSLNRKQ